MAQMQAVRNVNHQGNHTQVEPSSIGEAQLLGSGLVGVGERQWRANLEQTGRIQFTQYIQGTNPPARSYRFPEGGTVMLVQEGKNFSFVWNGKVDGMDQELTIAFGRGKAPALVQPEARMPPRP